MRNKANLGIHVSCLNVVVIIVSLFSSCAGETNIIDGNNNKLLSFSVSVPSWKSNDSISSSKDSRATPITDTSLGISNTFNLIADENDGSGNYSTLIDNKPVSYSNNLWKTKTDYYWSGTSSKTINFYAYYPTTISNSITHTAGSAPTLTYTVPDDVTNQPDIIAAKNTGVAGNTMTSTALSFNHIFAAIKFKSGSTGLPSGKGTIIKIKNVQYNGTYTFGGGWINSTNVKDFSQTVDLSTYGTSADITNGGTTFMMLPQAFSSITIEITYTNGLVLSKTISGTWEAGKTYTYNLMKSITYDYAYTGSAQTFTAPYRGTYKIECWGASGGDINGFLGGHGAYTIGNISLQKDKIIYIYVGQQGSAFVATSTPFNSGGNLINDNAQYQWGRNGGGATDIRLTNGTWNDFTGLKSRIMIAAGGGGANNRNSTNISTEVWYGDGNGGYGGSLIGGNGTSINHTNPTTGGAYGYTTSFGATQTAGGYYIYYVYNTTNKAFELSSTAITGHFGYTEGNVQTSGGGGYYAGSRSAHGGGSGGSSFISGYTGCNAIKEASIEGNIIHSDQPNHYSGYIFTNSTMIAGNASMPAPSGGTEIGHDGNGYARITFVSAD